MRARRALGPFGRAAPGSRRRLAEPWSCTPSSLLGWPRPKAGRARLGVAAVSRAGGAPDVGASPSRRARRGKTAVPIGRRTRSPCGHRPPRQVRPSSVRPSGRAYRGQQHQRAGYLVRAAQRTCRRAGCDSPSAACRVGGEGRQQWRACSPLRAKPRRATVPEVVTSRAAISLWVKGASSPSRPCSFYVRHGAWPSCRRRLPAGLPSACAKKGQQQAGLSSMRCYAAPCQCACCGCPRCGHRRVRRLPQQRQVRLNSRSLQCPVIAPDTGDRRVGTCLPVRSRRVPGWDPAAPGRFADVGRGVGRALRCPSNVPVVLAHSAAARAHAPGRTG